MNPRNNNINAKETLFTEGDGGEEISLANRLTNYASGAAYPLHMPGHKRRLGSLPDPYTIDITEIDGFDNLHHAEGILRAAQDRAAALYGARKTFFLVNGSTCGILAAVAACTRGQGRIAMARNCHKSAYHAVYENRLEVSFLYPKSFYVREGTFGSVDTPCSSGEPVNAGMLLCGWISAKETERVLQAHPEITTVLITSPTYDGVVSDVRAIAEATHQRGALLIVDEAHGAHFGMHPLFPPSSVEEGADIVIHSLHKTLPSLTQTALLHVCSDRVDISLVRRMLQIYQTSSPSYVLMSSMDACIRLLEREKEPLFAAFAARLTRFWEQAASLQVLEAVRTDDPSKIVLTGRKGGLSGPMLCDILRAEFGLEPEMAAPHYVLALLGIADTDEGFTRLWQALETIDTRLLAGQGVAAEDRKRKLPAPDAGLGLADPGLASVLEMARDEARHGGDPAPETVEKTTVRGDLFTAWKAPSKRISLQESAGCVSAEFVYLYPPGIPLLIPGEVISETLRDTLVMLREKGHELQGMEDLQGKEIRVISDWKPD